MYMGFLLCTRLNFSPVNLSHIDFIFRIERRALKGRGKFSLPNIKKFQNMKKTQIDRTIEKN